jgi:hypothetical protein
VLRDAQKELYAYQRLLQLKLAHLDEVIERFDELIQGIPHVDVGFVRTYKEQIKKQMVSKMSSLIHDFDLKSPKSTENPPNAVSPEPIPNLSINPATLIGDLHNKQEAAAVEEHEVGRLRAVVEDCEEESLLESSSSPNGHSKLIN